MADAWNGSWAYSWGNSWGETVGGSGSAAAHREINWLPPQEERESQEDQIRRIFAKARKKRQNLEQKAKQPSATAKLEQHLALAQREEAEAHRLLVERRGREEAEAFEEFLAQQWAIRERARIEQFSRFLKMKRLRDEEELIMVMLLA